MHSKREKSPEDRRDRKSRSPDPLLGIAGVVNGGRRGSARIDEVLYGFDSALGRSSRSGR